MPELSQSPAIAHPQSPLAELDGSQQDDKLSQHLSAVNKNHFGGRIQAKIIWQIPQGTVVTRDNNRLSYSLHPEEARNFQQAMLYISKTQIEAALQLLIPLADAGHTESQLACCHLLKRRQDPRWQNYARLYNRDAEQTSAVPAACYYPDTRTIALHPHLKHRKAPQFVLRYLIYHECCHQLLNTDQQNPHPKPFMKLEQLAPHRIRAIQWLEKEGYPVMREPLPPISIAEAE